MKERVNTMLVQFRKGWPALLIAVFACLIGVSTGFAKPVQPPRGGGGGGGKPPKPVEYNTAIIRYIYANYTQEEGGDEIDLYVAGKHVVDTDIGPAEFFQVDQQFQVGPSGLPLELQEDDGNRWLDENDVI